MNKCPRCPCPDVCLGRPSFCTWAAKTPQEPIEMRAICESSRIIGSNGQIRSIANTAYPPVQEQAGNLWRSLKRFVKSGGKIAPKSVRIERLATCGGCEFYDLGQSRCRKCGCNMKAKVYSAADSCPLPDPKWGALEPVPDHG